MIERTVQATESEMAALNALGVAGHVKGAAHRLGITERATRRRLERMCERLGVRTPIQAAYLIWGPGAGLSRSETALVRRRAPQEPRGRAGQLRPAAQPLRNGVATAR